MFAKPEQFSKNNFFQISMLLMTVTTIHKESKKSDLSVNSIVQNQVSIGKGAYQGFRYWAHKEVSFA